MINAIPIRLHVGNAAMSIGSRSAISADVRKAECNAQQTAEMRYMSKQDFHKLSAGLLSAMA